MSIIVQLGRLLFLLLLMLSVAWAQDGGAPAATCLGLSRIEVNTSHDEDAISPPYTSAYLAIYPDQVVRIEALVPTGETWEYTVANKTKLSNPVVVGGDGGAGFVAATCDTHLFVVPGLEPGYIHEVVLKKVGAASTDPTLVVMVRVNEVVHVELMTGPAFTFAQQPVFTLTTNTVDEVTTGNIREQANTGSQNLAVGAAFRPWGYDPRMPEFWDWSNFFVFLGTPINDKAFRSAYVGAGYGGRGVGLMGGVYVSGVTELRNGVARDSDFVVPSGAKVEDYTQTRVGFHFFASLVVGSDLFTKIFGKGTDS